MNVQVNAFDPAYDFFVTGVSYAGMPRDNTVMYIAKKVERLLANLEGASHCLIFAEDSIVVPEALRKKHCFVMTPTPQADYASFLIEATREEHEAERKKKYTLTEGGYYVGEDVSIGENAYIEPGVLLGHGVVIGSDATILSGAVIKHAVIGDHFYCNEHAVVGGNGFVMTEDREGNKYRIPNAGRVLIGDHVEIGISNCISRGSVSDTVIEDHVKISAFCKMAHDSHIGRNTEITAGCAVGGFSVIGERCFLGMNSAIRNRITLGAGCFIGMGSVVVRDVESGVTVCGNPARLLEKDK